MTVEPKGEPSALVLGIILGVATGVLESFLVGGAYWFDFPTGRDLRLFALGSLVLDVLLATLLVRLAQSLLGPVRAWQASVFLMLSAVISVQLLTNFRGKLEAFDARMGVAVALLVPTLAARLSRGLPAILPSEGKVRRGFLILALAVPLLAFMPDRLPPAAGSGPSVLLLIVDTLRADVLEPYGNPDTRTPILSRLSRRGTLYEEAITASNSTTSSLASILSGCYVSTHGVRGFHYLLGQEFETVAEVFKRKGYRTFGFSSSFPAHLAYHQFDQGLDFRDDTTATRLCRACPPMDGLKRLALFEALAAAGVDIDRSKVPTTREANRTTDAVLAFLESDRAAPFFGLVHYFDPHAPYSPPYVWSNYRKPVPRGLEVGDLDERFARAGQEKPIWLRRPHDVKDADFPLASYQGEAQLCDYEIGRMLAEVARRGERGRTIVMVTADHGESMLEHGMLFNHDGIYEPQIRVPWLMSGPGIAGGRLVHAPVRTVDIAPTIEALAGATISPGIDGRSIAGVLPPDVPSEPALTEAPTDVFVAVRQGGYKLLHDARSERDALYDLDGDPGEQQDLSAQKPEVARDLRCAMEKILRTGRPAAREAAASEEILDRLRAIGYVDGGARRRSLPTRPLERPCAP